MKQARSNPELRYGPVRRKTFEAALATELSRHIPTLGRLTAGALAAHLHRMVDRYFPPTERLRMGEVLWPAVARHETAGYGKRIEATQLQPVLLSLITYQDLEDRLQSIPKRKRLQKIAARLFEEAYQQGGVLTCSDVAVLLGLNVNTVSEYVQDYERATGATVPRRGTVHDMGPTVTHKRQICYRVIVQGRSIEETARDTNHSPDAVTRYVKDYHRIVHCLRRGFSIAETAYATQLTSRLVQEYADLQAELGAAQRKARQL